MKLFLDTNISFLIFQRNHLHFNCTPVANFTVFVDSVYIISKSRLQS